MDRDYIEASGGLQTAVADRDTDQDGVSVSLTKPRQSDDSLASLSNPRSPGSFYKASNFTINQPIMAERVDIHQHNSSGEYL